jgi:iron complex transport system ATP-binding protein
LVRKLNREQGITVVAVLHDLSLAAQFCDWLVLLKEAHIFEFGTPTEVITTTKIREVYGTDVIVRRHPVTGRPYVISGSRPAASHNGNGTRIHLICGGGSGAELMHRLVSEGYRISVGVLNVEDSDEETARLLSIPAVVEAPFSPVSPLSHKRNRQMALDADLVLVAETPFGYGNLLNLDAAESALEEGKPVIIIGSDFGSRDFVSGKAIEKLEKLITRGAYLVESIEEACRKAEEINAA